jgi:Protein phosphatase 2C
MIYHMDSYFAIGKQHANEGKPCQDYAIVRVEGDTAIAVVSDGCSAGGLTDVGARIVAHSILRVTKHKQWELLLCGENLNLPNWTIPSRLWLDSSAQGLSLVAEDLYATSLLIRADAESLKAHVLGDGVVAYKNSNGIICVHKYEWDKGVPYYPIYYPQDFVNQVCEGDWDAPAATRESWFFMHDEWVFLERVKMTAKEGIIGFSTSWKESLQLQSSQEFLAVFSDGVTQIKDVDWKDAVFQFLDFKNTTGQFVKRRMMKALKTMTPLDDISCAVLRISPDADNEDDADDT